MERCRQEIAAIETQIRIGNPDLQGLWDTRSFTPLERPTVFGTREFMTEKEAAERDRLGLTRVQSGDEDENSNDLAEQLVAVAQPQLILARIAARVGRLAHGSLQDEVRQHHAWHPVLDRAKRRAGFLIIVSQYRRLACRKRLSDSDGY